MRTVETGFGNHCAAHSYHNLCLKCSSFVFALISASFCNFPFNEEISQISKQFFYNFLRGPSITHLLYKLSLWNVSYQTNAILKLIACYFQTICHQWLCGDCMIVSKLVVACGHINVLNEESHFHPIRDLANDPSSNKTEADILPSILHVKTVENQTSTLIRFYGTVWSTIWRRKRRFHIKSWSLNAKWYLEATTDWSGFHFCLD